MLATYMRRMRNNILETKIAGSSCRPQYIFNEFVAETLNIKVSHVWSKLSDGFTIMQIEVLLSCKKKLNHTKGL